MSNAGRAGASVEARVSTGRLIPDGSSHPSLRALLEVCALVGRGESWRESLARVLQLLVREGWIEAGVAVLRNGKRLRTEAFCGFAMNADDLEADLGEGALGEVVASGRARFLTRADEEGVPPWVRRTAEEGGIACVPIRAGDEILGALMASVPTGGGAAALDLLQLVGEVVGMSAPGRIGTTHPVSGVSTDPAGIELSDGIVDGGAMRHVYRQIAQVAPTTATVLLRGESGTGKELIAKAIHSGSPRAGAPFITVSCTALPPGLIEVELFGAEEGAPPGAAAGSGLFERTRGGTIYLDEIGDLDLALQVKLLRILQQREVQRIGGSESVPVDVRVIAATHRDLERALSAGTFRPDLYERLNVFAIYVPPLRERKADVLLLANQLVERYAREYGKPIKRISTSAIDMLASYHWPGNIRELENTLMRAVLVCDGSVIHGHHLPPTLQTAEASGTVTHGSLADLVASYERNLIEDALKTTRGNRARAAQLLQTTDRILAYRIQQYGIDGRRFRT